MKTTYVNTIVVMLLAIAMSVSFSWADDLCEIGKVIGVYQRAKTTVFTVELEVKLPTGVVVLVNKETKATIGDLYSSENQRYIYEALCSAPNKVEKGALVYAYGVKKANGTEIYLQLTRRAAFEPKNQGRILASYGSRVSIDKGSFHEVENRDMYGVYDSTGNYKGTIEACGVGDYEAIARMCTGGSWQGQPGDSVVYFGKRRSMGLGVVFGCSLPIQPNIKDTLEKQDWKQNTTLTDFNQYVDSFKDWGADKNSVNMGLMGSTGLMWTWQYANGWGIQWIWSIYQYEYISDWQSVDRTVVDAAGNSAVTSRLSGRIVYDAKLYFPIVLKRNFNYPRWFSPYVGLGAGMFRNSFEEEKFLENSTGSNFADYTKSTLIEADGMVNYVTVFPVVGLDLFSAQPLHITLDAKYVPAWKHLVVADVDRTWSGFITSIAITMNW